MPNYAGPFGAAGAGVGAAGSAGILGTIGKAMEPLDYARQALWNAPRKAAEGDWMAALPGILGAAGGTALAATGVGLPLAVLLGSGIGAIGQGIGKASDEERFAAPTADDLVTSLGGDTSSLGGKAASFLTGAALDPLTYAGGLFGGKAGQAAGRDLEQAALARGPRFEGGRSKIGDLMAPPLDYGASFDKQMAQGQVDARLKGLMGSPHMNQVLGEIPPGSQYLGAGIEATAFKTPDGNVIRLAGGPGTIDTKIHPPGSIPSREQARVISNAGPGQIPEARPNLPEVLQPARDVAIGPYRVEHLPMMQMAPQPLSSGARAEWNAGNQALMDSLVERGAMPNDMHLGNLGRRGDTYWVTDAGAVVPQSGVNLPAGNTIDAANQPGWFKSKILDLLGSDQSVRQEMQAKLAGGPAGGVAVPRAPIDPNQVALSMEATNPIRGQARAAAAQPLSPDSLQSLLGADLEMLPELGMNAGQAAAGRANRALATLDQIPPDIRDLLVDKAYGVNRVVGDMARSRGLNPAQWGVR